MADLRIYAALGLVIGLNSAVSLGYTTTLTDPATKEIDFIKGTLKIQNEAGEATYRPALPFLKQGGQFMDTPLQDGRFLTAASNDNVTETFTVLSNGSVEARMTALSALLNTVRLLHDYETSLGSIGSAVSLKAQFVGSAWPQYSRIRKMEVDADANFLDPLNGEFAFTGITITIERDPYWQDIPIGANPKIYAFQNRGLEPSTVVGAPAASQYNHTNLPLDAIGGAASYQQYIEGTVYNFDEAGTTNVNYIDIPAASIPGDAPALALIRYGADAVAADAKPRAWIARSTTRDLYPATNDNSVTQRMRNTFNGGESSLVSLGGITASHQVDAVNGLLRVGGGVTRYIARLVSAAGGSTPTPGGISWTRSNNYKQAWNVWFRMRITAGTPANCTLQFRVNQAGALNGQIFIQRSLSGITASANWFQFFMGRIDLRPAKNRAISGLGSVGESMTFRVAVSKPNDGVAATIEIADVMLMPIDEPTVQIESLTPTDPLANFFTAYVDSTGYFFPDRLSTAMGVVSSNPLSLPVFGPVLTLIPNTINRIYFASQPINGVLTPTRTFPVGINIIPRWGAPRRASWE